MPKAVAPEPGEWATGRYGFQGFDLHELNQIVRDYAFIELHDASRWKRLPLVLRGILKLMPWIAGPAIGAPLVAVIFLAGGASERYSEVSLVAWVSICSALGGLAVLNFFVPWILQPYRQWPRTPIAIAIMVAVQVVAMLIMIYRVDPAIYPRWPMVVPVWFCLALSVGAMLGSYRFYSRSKPPSVDLDTLSADELEALKRCRRRALKVLRSKSIVAYKDFDEFDGAPL